VIPLPGARASRPPRLASSIGDRGAAGTAAQRWAEGARCPAGLAVAGNRSVKTLVNDWQPSPSVTLQGGKPLSGMAGASAPVKGVDLDSPDTIGHWRFATVGGALGCCLRNQRHRRRSTFFDGPLLTKGRVGFILDMARPW